MTLIDCLIWAILGFFAGCVFGVILASLISAGGGEEHDR